MPSLLKKLHLPTRKKAAGAEFQCSVDLLHQQEPTALTFHEDVLGEAVFDAVCESIGKLEEKDYFGLRFTTADGQQRWLDLRANAYKQLKHMSPIVVKLRVKHYPPEPADSVKQELARYLLFHQLKRDLLRGRLYSSVSEDAVHLAACIVQAEFGDFDSVPDHEQCNYLSGVPLIHNQTPKMESRVYEEHKELKGTTTAEAEALLLRKAFALDTYGIQPWAVRDRNGNCLLVGLSHQAFVTFHGTKLTHSFPWEAINSIRFTDKTLLLDVSPKSEAANDTAEFKYKKRQLLGFKCESKAAAAALWSWSLEQQLFFTLNKGSEARVMKAKTGMLRRNYNSFRFSGRSQKELYSYKEYFANLNSTLPAIQRTPVQRSSSSIVDRFATFPRRAKPDGMEDSLASSDTVATSTPKRAPAAAAASRAGDAATAALVHSQGGAAADATDAPVANGDLEAGSPTAAAAAAAGDTAGGIGVSSVAPPPAIPEEPEPQQQQQQEQQQQQQEQQQQQQQLLLTRPLVAAAAAHLAFYPSFHLLLLLLLLLWQQNCTCRHCWLRVNSSTCARAAAERDQAAAAAAASASVFTFSFLRDRQPPCAAAAAPAPFTSLPITATCAVSQPIVFFRREDGGCGASS